MVYVGRNLKDHLENHIPHPAGHASDAAKVMVGFLGCTCICVTLYALVITIMQQSHSLK